MIRPVDSTLLVRGTHDDPRLGSCVVGEGLDADVAVVGCADDTGVRNSGGRAGAAEGPTEIRRWLYKQTTGMAGELEGISIFDAGDVMPHATLEETHAEVERVVGELAKRVKRVVFLGGGHDLAYASHSGLLSAREGRLSVANVDTHLDVRPLKDGHVVTSGTPFRRLLERWGDRIGHYTVLGAQPQHNARAHAGWVRSREGTIVPLSELRDTVMPLAAHVGRAHHGGLFSLSLDLDVLAAAFGPGTSAPPADGLDPQQLVALVEAAGALPETALLDVVELSPPHDENGRTARVAALCIWRFLAAGRRAA